MEHIEIKQAQSEKEIQQALKIRHEVFIKGQNVPQDRDVDGLDKTATHFLVLDNNKPIGCARIRFIDAKAKIERVALLEGHRGQGIGFKLLKHLIEFSREKKMHEVYLHGQSYAQEFYERAGFKQRGDTFDDAGIEHKEFFMSFD